MNYEQQNNIYIIVYHQFNSLSSVVMYLPWAAKIEVKILLFSGTTVLIMSFFCSVIFSRFVLVSGNISV